MVLIEEQKLFRQGLRSILEGARLTVAGEYGSAAAALEMVGKKEALEPGTVVLCSQTLAGWADLVRRLLLQVPDCPIVGVVDEITEPVVIEAISEGLLSCIDRTVPPEKWIETVQEASDGRLSPVATMVQYPGAARHALMLLSQPLGPDGLQPLGPELGHRERMALSNVSEGVTLEEIVERMGMPEEDLQELLRSTCRKLVARHRLLLTLAQVR